VHLFLNVSVKELPDFMRKYYSGVINLQILMTKYLSFQYSVAYCSHLSESDVVLWEPVRCSRDRWWCRLLWAVWGIPTCYSLSKVQRWTANNIKMSCFINNFCQPFAMNLVDYQIWGKLQECVYHSRNSWCWPAKVTPGDRRVGTFPPGVHRWSDQAVASTWRTF